MKYLLDTHIIIWWSENNKRLKPEHKKIIADGNNIIFVSVVSVWEIIIKTKLKKIKLKTPIDEIIRKCGFNILDINLDHVLELNKLKNYHNDPFDRMLVSQSIVEKMKLITQDKLVTKYINY
ncbi:MAG: PilT protein [uncultured bacterium]|nr:MAG: PilT protein [uncultured bacterium]